MALGIGGISSLSSTPLAGVSSLAEDLQSKAETERATPLSSSSIDKDGFLQLLVAQLQNQDPTNPMDNMQFTQQLAQFASVEQLQNLNSNLQHSERAQQIAQVQGLVGKEVSYLKPDPSDPEAEGTRYRGVVDALRLLDNQTLALIDGEEIDLSQIDTIIRQDFELPSAAADTEEEASRPGQSPTSDGASEETSSRSLLDRLLGK